MTNMAVTPKMFDDFNWEELDDVLKGGTYSARRKLAGYYREQEGTKASVCLIIRTECIRFNDSLTLCKDVRSSFARQRTLA